MRPLTVALALIVGVGVVFYTCRAAAQEPASQPYVSPALSIEESKDVPPSREHERSGAFTTISTGALYGVLSGINLDVQLGVDSAQGAIGIPLLTGVAGGVAGHGYRKLHREGFTDAQAGALSVGTLFGVGEGILLPLAFEMETGEGRGLNRTWLGATGGLLAGVAAIELMEPQRGDAMMVSAGTLWGSALITEIFVLADGKGENFPEALTAGYSVGALTGLGLAIATDVDPYRLKIANGAGLLGALGGSLSGLLISAFVQPDDVDLLGKIVVSSTLIGQSAGFTTGMLLSR